MTLFIAEREGEQMSAKSRGIGIETGL